MVDSIPHDWLFPRIDMALHHGGAGTTGASLRAGLVTLIKPFFGDQFFWAQRLHKLGAGMRVASLQSNDLRDALKKAAESRIMVEKAKQVGDRIRTEKGVENAMRFMYENLSRAKRTPHFREKKPELKANDSESQKSRGGTSLSLLSIKSNTTDKSSNHATPSKPEESPISSPCTPSFELGNASGVSTPSGSEASHKELNMSRGSSMSQTRSSSSKLPEKQKHGNGDEPLGESHASADEMDPEARRTSFASHWPSLPSISMPNVFPTLSIPSALKREETDSPSAQDEKSANKPAPARTYQSAKLEDQRRAAALAPKMEELSLARKAASAVEGKRGSTTSE